MSQYQYGNVEFPAWAVKYLFPECQTQAEAYLRLAMDLSFPRFFVFQGPGIMPPIFSHAES